MLIKREVSVCVCADESMTESKRQRSSIYGGVLQEQVTLSSIERDERAEERALHWFIQKTLG